MAKVLADDDFSAWAHSLHVNLAGLRVVVCVAWMPGAFDAPRMELLANALEANHVVAGVGVMAAILQLHPEYLKHADIGLLYTVAALNQDHAQVVAAQKLCLAAIVTDPAEATRRVLGVVVPPNIVIRLTDGAQAFAQADGVDYAIEVAREDLENVGGVGDDAVNRHPSAGPGTAWGNEFWVNFCNMACSHAQTDAGANAAKIALASERLVIYRLRCTTDSDECVARLVEHAVNVAPNVRDALWTAMKEYTVPYVYNVASVIRC
ncbi:hypothetical protein BSKO_02676 [Bryopsis sp. KO-2023]|nr:hypothetical protein BSKO_02676 [Bryopsis sp. KO-2023]